MSPLCSELLADAEFEKDSDLGARLTPCAAFYRPGTESFNLHVRAMDEDLRRTVLVLSCILCFSALSLATVTLMNTVAVLLERSGLFQP